jgi:hypothetical protein
MCTHEYFPETVDATGNASADANPKHGQLRKFSSSLSTFPRSGFILGPLLFFLIPLKISLSIVIGGVIISIVAHAAFERCSPALHDLFSKFFSLYKNRFAARLVEFIEHMRPFILWGMFLSAPLAPIMMIAGWLQRLSEKIPEKRTTISIHRDSMLSLRLLQNLPEYPREHCENFTSSSFFTATAAVVFLSGIPAIATYAIYKFTGVDRAFGFPSHDPEFIRVFIIILLYVYSVGWCLSTLFFKAYFTFPLNYTSTENAIELDEKGIKTSHIKGWFSQVLFFCEPGYWPTELAWANVESVEYFQHGVGKLTPLPDLSLPGGASTLSLLNRFAALSDAVVEKCKPAAYILVNEHASSEHRPGKSIKVNLRELDRDGRENLFHALKKWAPDAVITDEAHFHLTGRRSKLNLKHSELWFNSLLAQHGRRNTSLLEPGQLLRDGTIEILKHTCTGGQANLYECVDDKGKVSILKEYVLAGNNGVDTLLDSAVEFENECRILSQLSHPKIPEYRGMFVEDKRAYVIQQKVSGESLRDLVSKKGKLSVSKAVHLAAQMCDLLDYMHGQFAPIVHRDFNPDNLVLSETGELFLVDFSNAHQAGTSKSVVCGGKQAYCAPEQFRGQSSERSDLYAFGATLYFLLVGDDPPAITNLSLASKDIAVPLELESIIARSTALDVRERYESARWIKLDLNEIGVDLEQ